MPETNGYYRSSRGSFLYASASHSLFGDSQWRWWRFAATALLLAGLGIYGTISYIVNGQRRFASHWELHETTSSGWSCAECSVCPRAGAGTGVAGALIVAHLMAGMLYGVSPGDLSMFAGVLLIS